MPVGVIGLGKVGIGVSSTLVDAGFDVVGYDLDGAARERAADAGVAVADDNNDLARRCEVIILCLPHPDASRAAVDAIAEHAQAGTDVFDTSTLSPLTARELHERAAEADVHYHDSPITGGEVGANRGELTVMIGGDPERIRAREDVLSTIAEAVYHIGEVGDGQFVKLVHNHVGQTTLVIFLEGCLLAEAFGVDPATLYRTLRHYTGIYDDKLDSFFSNEFPDEFDEHFAIGDDAGSAGNRFNLDVAHKDLVELRELADEYDAYLPLGSFVEQFHREGMNAGYGDRPHPDLLELYADLFDTDVESRAERREKSEGRLV